MPVAIPDHRTPLVAAGATSLGLVMLGLLEADGPTLCPFRLCTGHACPGCGMTRAATSLVRGDVDLAWRYHPVIFVLAAQAVVLAALGMAPGGRERLRRWTAGGRMNALAVANGVLLVGVWAVRWRWGLLDFVVS